jgi:hypothetical protein
MFNRTGVAKNKNAIGFSGSSFLVLYFYPASKICRIKDTNDLNLVLNYRYRNLFIRTPVHASIYLVLVMYCDMYRYLLHRRP